MAHEIPYLQQISDAAITRNLPILQEVKAAILDQGHWEVDEEWRISTVTTCRIEPEFAYDRWWFRVSVVCGGSELICHTKTLERALQFVGVFDGLTRDLMWTLGWAAWAAKDRSDPEPGETVAGPAMA